jgi:translation initiation factor 3 subunit H
MAAVASAWRVDEASTTNVMVEKKEQIVEVADVVQIDGLVLLKIIKHCKESMPDNVSGRLLGVDTDGRLEVTHSFPCPTGDDLVGFERDMMELLGQVNVDHNIVGWYQSALMGSFFNRGFIDAQFEHQKKYPNAVAIVYDPFVVNSARKFSIKAFRLTDEYMKFQATRESKSKRETLSDAHITSADVLEELPIKVHNSHLVHGFLYELREHKHLNCDYDRLDLTVSPFLEKSLDLTSNLIDSYAQEQGKYQYYLRQLARQKQNQERHLAQIEADNRARIAAGKAPLPKQDLSKHPLFKKIQPPSRLDSLLLAQQLDTQTTAINSAAIEATHKLYTLQALQQSLDAELENEDDDEAGDDMHASDNDDDDDKPSDLPDASED